MQLNEMQFDLLKKQLSNLNYPERWIFLLSVDLIQKKICLTSSQT